MKRKAGHGRTSRPGPRPAGPRRGLRPQGQGRRTGPAPLGASFIYALLSKNAVNRGFLRFSKSVKCCQDLATKGCDKFFVTKKACCGEWALSMVGVEEGREFRFRGDLYSQESTFPLVKYIFYRVSISQLCGHAGGA